MTKTLFITHDDLQQIQALLRQDGVLDLVPRQELDRLKQELLRAQVVSAENIPSQAVTLNSRVRVRDLSSNQVLTVTLVLPQDADFRSGRISILAPLGMAMLGYCAGDEFEWEMPRGPRRYRVEKILYQPEAAASA